MTRAPYIVVIFLALLLSSCGYQIKPNETAIPTLLVITATLPSTLLPLPSETPLPPPPSPTVAPVEGLTTTQLNVRAEPSTVSEVLGILPSNTTVQIVGKDPGGNWWQIQYPQIEAGKGWVTAQYVTTAGKPEVPVIGGGGADSNYGNTAVIQQQLNIRSGPGTSFNSLGTLNPQDVVTLTGKDANGAWLQIEFAPGPEGKGWINAAFAQATGVDNLPIIGDTGQVIGTGTPVDTPLPPTPTVVPAPNDNDSAQAPAIRVALTATGTRTFQFTSDVSSPAGDADDWIQFTPFTRTVLLEMTCRGNGGLAINLLQNSQPVPNWENMTCEASKVIAVNPGAVYLLHIQAGMESELNYTQFTVKVSSLP